MKTEMTVDVKPIKASISKKDFTLCRTQSPKRHPIRLCLS
jgi:hypothetical protein